jgi:hypothetical protein
MSLQEKYSSVVSAAQTAGISDLKVQEQDNCSALQLLGIIKNGLLDYDGAIANI